jgi:hypothetical protein
MDLLKRYEEAAKTSPTIAHVKTIGTAASPGVNFLDGVPRTRATAPDTVQTEFTPNAAGTITTPAATNNKTYPLSRWKPVGVQKGDAYLANTRFTTFGDVRNAAGTILHKFSQLADKSFFAAGGLSEFAKARANPNSSGYGPGPAGING